MYPIEELVRSAMAERGLPRGKLAIGMGYRNVSKALRRLDAFVAGDEATPEFRARLMAALGIEPDRFEQALEATHAVQREEERQRREAELAAKRAAFRPHLRVIPERRIPQPIFVAAFTGVDYWLVQPLPDDIMSMSPIRRLHVVGQIARAHYAQHKGSAGPFGAIRGYLFRTEFEHAVRLDTDGMVQGEQNGYVPLGKATLSIGGHPIPPSLWQHYGEDRR